MDKNEIIIEENNNKINNNIILNEKNIIENKPKVLPKYYKDFIEIKFDYGKGYILKTKVKKYNYLGK